MVTAFTMLTLLVTTVLLGTVTLVASAIGLRGGCAVWLFDSVPRWWSQAVLSAAGVRVELHGHVPAPEIAARIYVSNHVSWFDIPALVPALRRFSFIAKAEVLRFPLFGPAAKAVGTIPIERENRKAAFASYQLAGDAMREGRNVVVFPEGTRGTDYALRPFKKGPFVLAIASGAPVVPTIVYGTIHVNPRGSLRARPGRVDIHFLEPVPTAALTYADRDRLAALVWQRMADALRDLYGVHSPEPAAEREGTAA